MSAAGPDVQDPTRVLDGWQAPPSVPLQEVDLRTVLQGSRLLDEAKRARLKARGYEMQDVQDIDLPDVPARSREAPRVNLPAVRAEGGDPRLLARWQPLAWTAVVRRVVGDTAEITQVLGGPRVDSHPPQWLCAVWAPQSVEVPLLGRWPEMAALVGAQTPAGALYCLLPELPPRARLWLGSLDVDWGLLADLVRHQDASLRPAQAQALLVLAEAERAASFERLNDAYARVGRVARRRA